ncbi:portal vertex protein of the head [Erwinia phage phiEa2809]|uniref:Portal protein n=1 Tax=Erwinia phage phiEa2809 TaxID=1564096 RepID=A0A0A0YSB8_9CAUD|nr:portal protein [Erwinia phage phiEa2809]AIX13119.1 portal vertex protein of the head [Erwinia phage phiEa2809]
MLGFGGLFNNYEVKTKETSAKTLKQEDRLYDRATVVAIDDAVEGSIILQGGNNSFHSNTVASELISVKALVEEYQSMAQQPEVEEAIDIIINDVVTCDEEESPVTLNMDQLDGISEDIKKKVADEFKNILLLMNFDDTAYDKIRSWYVDGRQAFHVIVDDKNTTAGIQKIIQLDSRCVRPVTIIEREAREKGVEAIKSIRKQYYYNPNNVRNTFTGQNTSSGGIKPNGQELMFDEDSIVYADSGLESLVNGIVPGFLNPAIRPLNNLVTCEDATVIYAITRAPEKRAWYLDVGTLPKKSAEEYMQMMMAKFKTNMSYDRTSGKIQTGTSLMGIAEDYWLPRREGQNATEIDTLGGGDQLGNMDHVMYFLKKLYRALKIPSSRIDDGGGNINIGGSDLAEVTREEYRFAKFCTRLRRQYSSIFETLLRRQCILKKITTEDDWQRLFKNRIRYEFTSDNFIKEQQENEILAGRMSTLATVEPYIGKVFSIEYAQRNILRMSEQDITDQQAQIEKEKSEGKYPDVMEGDNPADVSPMKFTPNRIPAPSSPDNE